MKHRLIGDAENAIFSKKSEMSLPWSRRRPQKPMHKGLRAREGYFNIPIESSNLSADDITALC